MARRWFLWFLVVLIGLSIQAFPEDKTGDIQAVESPYQGEYLFKAGQPLEIQLQIDGVYWSGFGINPGKPDKLKSGETHRIEVVNRLENVSKHGVKFALVVLLEDTDGKMLERLRLSPVKLSKGKYRTDRQKFKVSDDSLINLAKVYFFAEITE